MIVRLGIDAGGSRSTLVALDADGQELYRDSGPSIHAVMQPIEEQVAGVTRLVATLRHARPDLRPEAVCLGVAGGGRLFEQTRLREALEPLFPGWRILVTSDAHTAHADAFRNGDGILVITGTGSMVLGRCNGTWDRAGGYGYLIGDAAGGYRMGQEGLFACCTALDGGEPTSLTTALAAEFEITTRDDLIRAVYSEQLYPAKLAPAVLREAEAGDPVAAGIVARNTQLLGGQVALAARKLNLSRPAVAVIGGLINNDGFRTAFRAAVHAHLPDATFSDAVPDAARGAVAMLGPSL